MRKMIVFRLSRESVAIVYKGLNVFDDSPELFADLTRYLLQRWIIDSLHGCHRIDRRHLHLTLPGFLHDYIARQHGADFIFRLQRLVRQRRIASAEYFIGSEIHIEFLFQFGLDIDFRQNTEALFFKGLLCPGNGVRKRGL